MADIMKKKRKGFLNTVFHWGEHIGNFFMIQLLSLLYTLKGGVFLGIFPSIAATFKYCVKLIINQDSVISVYKEFGVAWKKYFSVANKVGYTLLLGFGFLYIDLRINEQFIRFSILHTLLLGCIFLLAFITIYTFIVMVGHDLTYKQTLKQAFFVSLSTPLFAIAAILGLMLSYEIIKFAPFVGVFFGIPLLVLPVAWFTFSGLVKIDELKEESNKSKK